MRLYWFSHNGGVFFLPTKNADSESSKRVSRVRFAPTANGYIADINAGNQEIPAPLSHTGTYLFASEAAFQALQQHLEAQTFPLAGQLLRGSAEDGTEVDVALPPNPNTTPSLTDTVDAYLETYVLRRTSGSKVGGKVAAVGSFTFKIANQNATNGGWS